MKKSLLFLFFAFVITDASTMDCSNTATQMREVICSDPKLITLYEDAHNTFYQVGNKVNIYNLPFFHMNFLTWKVHMEEECVLDKNQKDSVGCLTTSISDEIKQLNDILNNPDWLEN